VPEELLVLHRKNCVDHLDGNVGVRHNLSNDEGIQLANLITVTIVDLTALRSRSEVDVYLGARQIYSREDRVPVRSNGYARSSDDASSEYHGKDNPEDAADSPNETTHSADNGTPNASLNIGGHALPNMLRGAWHRAATPHLLAKPCDRCDRYPRPARQHVGVSSPTRHTRRALIVAGGEVPDIGSLESHVPHEAYVVAADSGLDRAEALGIAVDVLIGDLDSVTPSALERAMRNGVNVVRHSQDKDQTDLELAIAHCHETGVLAITTICAEGGRLDHELANIMVLCSPRWSGIEITVVGERARLLPIHTSRELPVGAGATVTLMAIGGPAHGVTTTGLQWSLDGETLWPDSSRGTSNVATEPSPTVDVLDGTVLAILPWTTK